MNKIFSYSIVFILGISLNACGFLNAGNLLTNSVLTGGSGASSEDIEGLSEIESNLFETGSVDLPVTIAKLDSPNSESISVSVTGGASPSQNLRSGYLSSRYLSSRFLTADTDYTFTFSGAAGSVSDPELTPYILLLNNATGETEIATVSGTGSWTVALTGSISDDFSITNITDSDLTVAVGGAVVTVSVQSDETIVTSVTNTDYLDVRTTINKDVSGYVYFSTYNDISAEHDARTYNLLRRNLDGSPLEILLSYHPYRIRTITVLSSTQIVYLDDIGNIYYKNLSQDSDAVIVTNVGDISSLGTNDAVPYTISPVGSLGFIVAQIADNSISLISEGTLARYFAIVNGAVVDGVSLVPATDGEVEGGVYAAGFDSGLVYLMVNRASPPDYSLYSVDVADGEQAWDNRILLQAHATDTAVVSMEATEDKVLYVAAGAAQQQPVYYLWTQADGVQEILNALTIGLPLSDKIKLSPSGDFALTCDIRTTEGDVIILPLDRGLDGDFVTLTSPGTCTVNNFYIDPNNDVYLYYVRHQGEDKYKELSIIDANTVQLIEDLQ